MNKMLVVMGVLAVQSAVAVPDLTASLEFVCDPSAARWGTGSAQARSILDLQVYQDRIFPGMGDWGHNSGPVYAMAIDPYTCACSNEYTMGTESCETIRVLADGNLYFPATDLKDGHTSAGYWFRRTAAGEWYTRKSALVDSKLSIHFWDFCEFEGRLFAAGYGIASSKDGGTTWTDVNPAWKGTSERFVAFLTCGDELFARTQRGIPFNYKTGVLEDSKPTDLYQYPGIYHHWNKTTQMFETITNSCLLLDAGLQRSDFALSYASLANKASVNGHLWHATPFKDRCLYVMGNANGILTMTGSYTPVGTYPAAAFSAYSENGALRGQRITLEEGAYPYDFLVYGDAAYLFSFKYKSETQMVEHGVWKSTDGITFTKVFTFDFQQVMSAFEYHRGYFYFGAAFLQAQPYLGTLKSGITDKAGSVYRAWYPLEPVAVTATTDKVEFTLGSSTSVGFSLASAPATNVTLDVSFLSDVPLTVSPKSLVFTPSDWSTPKTVQISGAVGQPAHQGLRLSCGARSASPRGIHDSAEVMSTTLTVDCYVPYDPANPIMTADEFVAAMHMSTSADYRLGANISFAGKDNPCTDYSGTLSGCGKKITGLKKPLFRTLSGTVENLSLESASVTEILTDWGAVAITNNGGRIAQVALRNLSVKTSGSIAKRSLGFVAGVATAGAVFENCDVASNCSFQQRYSYLGGIAGTVVTSSVWKVSKGVLAGFYSCTNAGTLKTWSTGSCRVGGILGQANAFASTQPRTILSNCVNHAEISSTKDIDAYVGGLVGERFAYTSGTRGTLEIVDCANNGNILSHGSQGQLGGAIGCAYRIGGISIVRFANRGNIGTGFSAAVSTNAVTSGYSAGFIGFVRDLRNLAPIHVSDSANFGRIIGGAGAAAFFGCVAPMASESDTRCTATNCANYALITGVCSPSAVGEVFGCFSNAPAASATHVYGAWNCYSPTATLLGQNGGAEVSFVNCFSADATGYDVASATGQLAAWARARGLTSWKMGKVGTGVAPVLGNGPANYTDPMGRLPIVEVPAPGFSGESGQAPHVVASGDFAVSIANAVSGVTYGVYATESLSEPNWRRVQTVTADADGALAFVVATSRAPSLFVKVVVEPTNEEK